MDPDQPHIDSALVRHLVTTQFPRWADLSVAPVENGGWCNRVFHLGDEMIVRLPRHRAYAEQTAKEYQWLPRLAPLLPLPIPEPLAIGEPAGDYPWQWSVYRWIEGDPALPERITNMTTFATDLGSFLAAMQSLDTMSGPPPGPHNFYRGGSLATYDSQTRQAIAALEGKVDTDAAMEVWETALSATWADAPVWIHGDVSVGNLLVRNGRGSDLDRVQWRKPRVLSCQASPGRRNLGARSRLGSMEGSHRCGRLYARQRLRRFRLTAMEDH